jgi:hypothetical protein
VAEVTQALQTWTPPRAATGADIGVQLQKTVEDLSQLRGQVETYLYKIGELERRSPRRARTPTSASGAQGRGGPKEAEARKKAEELQRPTDKKEFLALAQEKARAGDSVLARAALLGVPQEVAQGRAGGGPTSAWARRTSRGQVPRGPLRVPQGAAGLPQGLLRADAYLRSSDCFKKLKMQEESRWRSRSS